MIRSDGGLFRGRVNITGRAAGAATPALAPPGRSFHGGGATEDRRRMSLFLGVASAQRSRRSEERRVGKACFWTRRSRWSQYHVQNNSDYQQPHAKRTPHTNLSPQISSTNN